MLVSGSGELLFSRYGSNKGRPLDVIRGILSELYENLPESAYIAYAASTGYGENLAKAAFTLDCGEVETIAHYTAAKYFCPDVEFILDIGGQDMKCMHIPRGRHRRGDTERGVLIGLRLVSGNVCGVAELRHTGVRTAGAVRAQTGGPRQPLHGIHELQGAQAQKEGTTLAGISAGLSYSVIKNALYKVIKLKNPGDLGRRIVVQGGTFLNDAVLRAFERLTEREVTRPAHRRADGRVRRGADCEAALPARARYRRSSPPKALKVMEITQTFARCKGCENKCRLTISHFGDGRKFISGNRCEKGAGETASAGSKLPDLYDYTYKRLFAYEPLAAEQAERGEMGIPRVLGMYENYPFWHTFFTALKYRVVLSPRSSRAVYSAGIESIPSESLCYPAKLAHGAVRLLIDTGVKTIFFPCIPYEKKEQKKAANNFNCPIVTSYAENIKNNMPKSKRTA